MRRLICAVIAVLVLGAGGTAVSVRPAAAGSAPALVVQPGGFTWLPPTRLADNGVAALGRVSVLVAGRGGVPTSGVSAVLLSLTVSDPAAAGALTAYPHGAAPPGLAQVSFAAGGTAQSLVVVPLGPSGTVDVDNRSPGGVHLSVDVVGYYRMGGSDTPGAFTPLTPAPVGGSLSVTAGHAVTVQVAGVAGVPKRGAEAVLLNLTASGSDGRLVAYRHGTERPDRATTLATSAAAASTQAVVQVGEDGSIDLYNDASTGAAQVSVHVIGYFRAGPAVAAGMLASRKARNLLDTQVQPAGKIAAHDSRTLQTGGLEEWTVPAGSVAVYMVTVPAPEAAGSITAVPHGTTPPAVPSLSFSAGRTTSGLVVVPEGTEDSVDFVNNSSAAVDLSVDLVGLYTDGTLGAITGRVTDPTGHPVEGVNVAANTNGDRDPRYHDPVATGADGTYALGGLPASDNYLVCFSPALSRGSTSPNGDLDGCFEGSDTGRVVVQAGQVTAHINQRLVPGGAITGTVTDTAGHPLGNVDVDVSASLPTGARTATDGTYRVNRLEPGGYTVCFGQSDTPITGGTSTTGYVGACDHADIPNAGDTAVVDIQLVAGGEISGRVTDADGNPISGVKIALMTAGSSLNVAGYGPTAADGSYDIKSLEAGTYRLCFVAEEASGGRSTTGYLGQCYAGFPLPFGPGLSKPVQGTNIVVEPGRADTGIDASLADGGAIRGTVTGLDGQPRPGVTVLVRQSPYLYGNVSTAADGTYQVTGLRADTYSVCFFPQLGDQVPPPSGLLNQCFDNAKPSLDQNVPVTLGQFTDHIDAHLNAGGQISGRVTDTAGSPLAGVKVHVLGGAFSGDVRTAPDGTYTVRYVYPGTAQLCFSAQGATGGGSATGYLDECYDNVAPDGTPTAIPVTAGQTTTGIDAALLPAGSIIATATDQAGHPLAGITASYKLPDAPYGVGRTTGADGSATFLNLTPGTYQVCFRTPEFTPVTGGESEGGYGDVCLDSVQVAADGTPTRVTQALPELAAVSGRVTDQNGAPLGSVRVSLRDSSGTEFPPYTSVFTKTDGSYEVTRVPPGTYTICFDRFSGPGSFQCWDHTTTQPTPLTLTAGHRLTGIDATLTVGLAATAKRAM
jgi:hypothetical protein